jgi:lipoprotein-anchoring transpeptidase ErfK/SrfK
VTQAPTPPPAPHTRRGIAWVALITGAAAVVALVAFVVLGPGHARTSPNDASDAGRAPAATSSSPRAEAVPVASPAAVASLPAVRYDAVIGGLMPFTGAADSVAGRYELTQDAAIYGADRRTPVAKFPAKDFLDEPSTVVVVRSDGGWDLVLTPARVALPSASGGAAPAQSAGWVRASDLHRVANIDTKVVISVGAQTLTISKPGTPDVTYTVGVGTPSTPTPTDVTGYLQQRYLDPSQGEAVYPIQLTSLHASTKDEPYGGEDGGLIGIHYNPTNSGAVSHGCVRLTQEAIVAVNRLPLGTPVTIVN